MIRRAFWFAAICIAPLLVHPIRHASANPPPPSSAELTASLRLAAQFLWNQQGADGGWHSPQYGVLRSGQALTPFVLDALLDVPESICPRPAGSVARGLEFIRKHLDENGALGHSDPDIIEYPVYSTAHALQCFTKIGRDRTLWKDSDVGITTRMFLFLRSAQFTEANKFSTLDPAYGGWGLDVAKGDGQPGHMDLAHTRRALEALRAFALNQATPEFTRGELFLRVVQRHPGRLAPGPPVLEYPSRWTDVPYDGGFYFSPVVEQANKGRMIAGGDDGKRVLHYPSYATATCDGVLALLACRIAKSDERVTKAAEWLRAHEDFDYPEGVPHDHPEPWGDAIRFYHYSVRAEAYAALEWPGDWRTRLAAAVTKHQAADGSFRNSVSPLMKEDDPILCTGLAVVALARCAE